MSPPATDRPAAPPLREPSGPAARLVDDALDGPAVVIGSLPPGGRDVDVLVRDADLPALERKLAEGGFERQGGQWVRFGGGRIDVVEPSPASSWCVTPSAMRRLFDDASPLPPYRRLRRPSPVDELLLLARRRLGVHGPLAPQHRRRAEEAAGRASWAEAAERAPAWGVPEALEVLRRATTVGSAPLPLRVTAAVEAARQDGAGRTRALGAGVRLLVPARSPGGVIALSGIDGSGKSTQAALLARALDLLGHPATVEWSRITYEPALRVIGGAPRTLLRWWHGRGRPAPPSVDGGAADEDAGASAAAALRLRRPGLNQVWALVVAVVHGTAQRRALRPHLRQGRLVVRDRYVLDAMVQLDDVYGRQQAVPVQLALLRRLCPTPVAAFWLDVDPEEAFRRKPEEYTAEELAAHRHGYESAHEQLGVVRVDAGRPAEVIAAEVARHVWLRLR
jgi:thymidylate kinase